jgi:hypothetical protein
MPPVIIGAVAAGALSTAVAAATGFGLIAGSLLTTFAVSFGTSLVLGGLSFALQKKPKGGGGDGGSSIAFEGRDRTVTVRQPTAPWRVVYGRARVGGTYAFVASSTDSGGRANGYLHLVIALAGHEIEEIESIAFDDYTISLEASGNGFIVTSSDRFYSANGSTVYLEKYLGTTTQTASSYLASLGIGWTDNHRLRGRAYLYVRLLWDPDKYPNGIPNISAVIKGRKVYDPRTGLTEYSTNPVLCVADYITNTDFGLGADFNTEIDSDTVIAEANLCEESVSLADGGTEDRYTCNGSFTTDKTPKVIIEELLTSMAGKVVYVGGKWRIYAGTFRTPTVTLDESHLRSNLRVRSRVSRRENFNAIKGLYVSEANFWQPSDFPPLISDTYAAEDNDERVFKDINLPYTISSATAQRLAKIELLKARQQITVTMPCTLAAYQLQVPEVVSVNNTRMGWSEKAFEVVSSSLVLERDDQDVPYLACDLVLRETDGSVYSWLTSEEQAEDPAPDTNLHDPFTVEAPGIPSITEQLYETVESAGVNVRTVIEWSAPNQAFIGSYEVKVTNVDTEVVTTHPITRATSYQITNLEVGTYDFSVKAISDLGVSSLYSTARKEIRGLSGVPSDVTGLTMVAVSGDAYLSWDRHADLDVRRGGFLRFRWSSVTSSATWDSAIDIGDIVDGNATQVKLPLVAGTYLVKAVDSSGVYSDNAATVYNNGANPFTYTNLGTISEGTSFPGTKSNCGVSAGRLMLSGSAAFDDITDLDAVTDLDTEGGIASQGTYNFNSGFDGTTVRKMRLTASVGASVVNTLDTIDLRGANIDDWENFDGTTTGAAGVKIEMRTTDNDPAGTGATWSAWHRFFVCDVQCRGVQFRAIPFSEDPAYNISIGTLAVSVDTLSA